MNKLIKYFSVTILALLFINCGGNKSLYDGSIKTEATCTDNDGYWYKNKCWTGFEDEGIAITEIDNFVQEEIKLIEDSKITVNSSEYPIDFFFPEIDGKEVIFITIFSDREGPKTMIQTAKMKQAKSGSFTTDAILFQGNLVELSEDDKAPVILASGPLKVVVNNFDELDLSFSGLLINEESKNSYQLAYQTNESVLGAGTSTVEVKGDEIHINGELGTRTYHQLKTAIQENPNAKIAILGQINGSVNDAVNMHTGRILHEAGLTTKVLSNSDIASGGVDLFCAGTKRIVEKGARIGIHSWCCIDDLTAVELPKDHPAHQYQISYFTMCMGVDNGPDFYFHTLTAAPFDGVHYMSDEDIKKWNVATIFVE